MRSIRPITMIGIGAAVVSLALTAVVGTAIAQTANPPTTQGTAPAKTRSAPGYQSQFLERLAADLGSSVDKLKAALTQARNETVDQAVKDGRLTQQQADRIKARPATMPGPAFRFGRGDVAGRARDRAAVLGAPERASVAQALGMSPQELSAQLRTKTLAQIAQGKEQRVKDAISSALKARLDQAVKDGRITQDQENQRLSQVQRLDLSKIGGHQPSAARPGWRGERRQAPTS